MNAIAYAPKKKRPRWLEVLDAVFLLVLRAFGWLSGAAFAIVAFLVGLMVLALVVGGLLLLNDLVWGQLQ